MANRGRHRKKQLKLINVYDTITMNGLYYRILTYKDLKTGKPYSKATYYYVK